MPFGGSIDGDKCSFIYKKENRISYFFIYAIYPVIRKAHRSRTSSVVALRCAVAHSNSIRNPVCI